MQLQAFSLECVDKKDAGTLGEFLRLLFSLTLLYYNSCDLSAEIDKIWNFLRDKVVRLIEGMLV